MDIETYGGTCPCCSKPMFQKASTNSHSFQFDACAHCGFAYGEIMAEEASPIEVWNGVLSHHEVDTLAELRAIAVTMSVDDELSPSVFHYAAASRDALAARQLPDVDLSSTVDQSGPKPASALTS